jgi:DNA-binding transcriptional regulator YdaS (Cro superfamily)
MKNLQSAVDLVGSQAALAAAIGVKQQHIWNWLNRKGARIPAEHCPAIERATKGEVKCEDLRPDVAWDVLRLQTGQEAA